MGRNMGRSMGGPILQQSTTKNDGLDKTVQAKMEKSFGQDFSAVKVTENSSEATNFDVNFPKIDTFKIHPNQLFYYLGRNFSYFIDKEYYISLKDDTLSVHREKLKDSLIYDHFNMKVFAKN